MTPIFITGIGTDVGKTIASVIIANALEADYWKPVQAGTGEPTDTEWVNSMLLKKRVHPETYRLKRGVSPHIAARKDGVTIDLHKILAQYHLLRSEDRHLVIEGAGGLLVPLNDDEFVIDLIAKLNARVILVSRNYLGSINHSLLTADACKRKGLNVLGWVFCDEYMEYQQEISRWSGYPVIGKIPKLEKITPEILYHLSLQHKGELLRLLEFSNT